MCKNLGLLYACFYCFNKKKIKFEYRMSLSTTAVSGFEVKSEITVDDEQVSRFA